MLPKNGTPGTRSGSDTCSTEDESFEGKRLAFAAVLLPFIVRQSYHRKRNPSSKRLPFPPPKRQTGAARVSVVLFPRKDGKEETPSKDLPSCEPFLMKRKEERTSHAEKEQMDQPQEEFISSESVPSKDKSAVPEEEKMSGEKEKPNQGLR